MERPSFGVDVIGDIHGQLAALESLVEELGYDADGSHPEDRRLLFVGDLVDRGPASYEVSRWVADRCAEGRALCLLGNHELNLVEWRAGRTKPKASNRATIEQNESRP
ncbi:MAG: metallophosphoesterase, partial [Deltaproteobacteria bacterium]